MSVLNQTSTMAPMTVFTKSVALFASVAEASGRRSWFSLVEKYEAEWFDAAEKRD